MPKPKLKIGLVLDDTLDTPDGVQQYVLRVGEWLKLQGHEVHYLVGQTIRSDIEQLHSMSRNVAVSFNGNKMSMPLPASRNGIRELLDREQFDVLHIQLPYSPFMAGRIIKAAPKRTAVIGTFHILPHSKLAHVGNHALAVLNRQTAKRLDKVLAVSEPAQQFAKQVYGYEASVSPNPVDVADYVRNLPTGKPLNVVFLGRLVPRKGAQQLLRSVAYIREHEMAKEPFRVLIGGKGSLLPKLQAFVRQHRLDDIVQFAGFVPENEKADFLAQADVAAFPSTGGESFGIVLIEAMAAARGIVLAGDNSGYSSVMGTHTDQLVNPRNITTFAKILARALNSKSARDTARAWQQEHVKQFDINLVGKSLEALYTEVVEQKATMV